jgi:regulator of sigma E protease
MYFLGVVGSGSFIRMGFWQAGVQAFKEAWSKTLFIAEMVGRLFSQESSLRDNLGGPVMVAQTVHQQATHAGIIGVLKLTALLSINLGLLNLLPIPVLDGGHVLFNSIEMIFRRPIPERVQNLCTYLGFALLIVLMLLATAFDLFRLAG